MFYIYILIRTSLVGLCVCFMIYWLSPSVRFHVLWNKVYLIDPYSFSECYLCLGVARWNMDVQDCQMIGSYMLMFLPKFAPIDLQITQFSQFSTMALMSHFELTNIVIHFVVGPSWPCYQDHFISSKKYRYRHYYQGPFNSNN